MRRLIHPILVTIFISLISYFVAGFIIMITMFITGPEQYIMQLWWIIPSFILAIFLAVVVAGKLFDL